MANKTMNLDFAKISMIQPDQESQSQFDLNESLEVKLVPEIKSLEEIGKVVWKLDKQCFICEKVFSLIQSRHHW